MATTLMTRTMTLDEQEMDAQEVDAAREDVAARLERLARRVRHTTRHATVAQLEAFYSEVVKLAAQFKDIMD